MKRQLSVIAAVLVWAGSVVGGQTKPVGKGAKLSVGDAAPGFKVGGFAQGGVAGLERGQVYVLEFWATWCGPCVAAMPHLSTLSEEYKGKVTFIGVDGMERLTAAEKEAGVDAMGKVKGFLEKNPGKMTYHVTVDTAEGDMVNGWFNAAGQSGIPCTFIVDKETKIAWIGHPMQMDGVLKQVVEGTFDAKKHDAEQKAKLSAEQKAVNEIRETMRAGDYAGALALIAEFEKSFPDKAGMVGMPKFQSILKTDEGKAVAMLDEAREAKHVPNMFNWGQVVGRTPKLKGETYEAARKALEGIKKADKPGDSAMLSMVISQLYVTAGQKGKAVEYAEMAVSEAKAGNLGAERVEQYEKVVERVKGMEEKN